MDSVGLIFIGLSVMFLIAILLGYQKREHMSNDTSAWFTIRREVEDELSKNFNINLAEFRYETTNQNEFYKDENMVSALNEIRRVAFFADLSLPDIKDIKNTDALFDEKMKLLKKSYKEAVDNANGKGKGKTKEDILISILIREHLKMGIAHLKNMAKMWMFAKVQRKDKDFLKLKTTTDKVSTSISASISNIIG